MNERGRVRLRRPGNAFAFQAIPLMLLGALTWWSGTRRARAVEEPAA